LSLRISMPHNCSQHLYY